LSYGGGGRRGALFYAGFRVTAAAIGFGAEYVVGVVEDHLALFLGDFVAGIGAFALNGAGRGVAVFLEGQGFAGQAGEGVDQASEFFGLRLVGGIGGAAGEAEAHKLIEHLGGRNAQGGFVNCAGVWGGEDIGGELGFGGQALKPFALEKPILVGAVFPAGEVHLGNGVRQRWSGVLELLENGGIGEAVLEHEVDFVANFPGQPGDLAIGAPGEHGLSRR